jgi:hypothetical protein
MDIPTCYVCKEEMYLVPAGKVLQTIPRGVAEKYATENFGILHTHCWWKCMECGEYFYEGSFRQSENLPK